MAAAFAIFKKPIFVGLPLGMNLVVSLSKHMFSVGFQQSDELVRVYMVIISEDSKLRFRYEGANTTLAGYLIISIINLKFVDVYSLFLHQYLHAGVNSLS